VAAEEDAKNWQHSNLQQKYQHKSQSFVLSCAFFSCTPLPSGLHVISKTNELDPLRCCSLLFSFSQNCSLLSGSLALEALLIGVHCKKCYIGLNV